MQLFDLFCEYLKKKKILKEILRIQKSRPKQAFQRKHYEFFRNRKLIKKNLLRFIILRLRLWQTTNCAQKFFLSILSSRKARKSVTNFTFLHRLEVRLYRGSQHVLKKRLFLDRYSPNVRRNIRKMFSKYIDRTVLLQPHTL